MITSGFTISSEEGERLKYFIDGVEVTTTQFMMAGVTYSKKSRRRMRI